MMGPRPQCYIPSHKVIGPLVLKMFWRVFIIYGRGGNLGHVTQTLWTNFCSPNPWRLYMKFDFDWPRCFGEEDLWKWWTDGAEHAYTISSPMSLKAACLTVSVRGKWHLADWDYFTWLYRGYLIFSVQDRILFHQKHYFHEWQIQVLMFMSEIKFDLTLKKKNSVFIFNSSISNN